MDGKQIGGLLALVALAAGGAWLTMSGVDVGDDVEAVIPPTVEPSVAAAEPMEPPPEIPPARPLAEGEQAFGNGGDARPLAGPLTGRDDWPTAMDEEDAARMEQIVTRTMAIHVARMEDRFRDAGAALGNVPGRAAADAALEDGLDKMRQVEQLLADGKIESGEAFARIAEIKNASAEAVVAAVGEGASEEARRALGVHPDNEDVELGWGVPLDEETMEVIFGGDP